MRRLVTRPGYVQCFGTSSAPQGMHWNMVGHGAVFVELASKRTASSPHVVVFCRTLLTLAASQQAPILACARPRVATSTRNTTDNARICVRRVKDVTSGVTRGANVVNRVSTQLRSHAVARSAASRSLLNSAWSSPM